MKEHLSSQKIRIQEILAKLDRIEIVFCPSFLHEEEKVMTDRLFLCGIGSTHPIVVRPCLLHLKEYEELCKEPSYQKYMREFFL